MNSKSQRYLGILINGDGPFDVEMTEYMINHIQSVANSMRSKHIAVNHSSLSRVFGIHRNRVARILKALDIIDVLDCYANR